MHMDKVKKVKIILSVIYLVILSTFLYFLFHNFKFEDISSMKFIHSNQDQLNLLKENNLILLILIFVIHHPYKNFSFFSWFYTVL